MIFSRMIKNTLFQQLGEIYSYCRILMRETPSRAELDYVTASNCDIFALKGNCIAKIVVDGRPEQEFIVAKNGVKKTIKVLSDKEKKQEIKYININAKNSKRVYNILKEKCDNIMRIYGSEVYNKFRLDEIQNSIAFYYEDCRHLFYNNIIMSALDTVPKPQYLRKDLISQWTTNCISKLASDYHKFKLSGNILTSPLTNILFLKYLCNNSSEKNVIEIYKYILNNYITTNIAPVIFKQLTKNEITSFISYLYDIATDLRNEAQKSSTYQLFQKKLYEALLFYHSVLFLDYYRSDNYIQLDEIKQYTYMSEEIRVLIDISIKPFYRDNIPDFTKSRVLFEALKFRGSNYSQYQSAGKHALHELYQKLYIPNRIKQIGLSLLILNKPNEFNQNELNKLMILIKEIEKETLLYEICGELDYLINLYQFLIEYYILYGYKREAMLYKQKLDSCLLNMSK